MSFGKEVGRALAGGLIAPVRKHSSSLLRDGSSAETIRAELIDSLCHDADELLALSEEDDGKRAGSVTESNNSSASEAKKKKKAVTYFAITRTEQDNVAHSGGTLIMLSEEDLANALSLCGDGEARGH